MHRKIKKIGRIAVLLAIMLAFSAVCYGENGIETFTCSAEWEKYEPCSSLTIPMEKIEGGIIAGKMTHGNPTVVWTAQPLNQQEQNAVVNSLKGNPGVGNPKSFVFVSGEKAGEYGMQVDAETGVVTFLQTSDWALIYGGQYSYAAPDESDPAPGPDDAQEGILDGTEAEREDIPEKGPSVSGPEKPEAETSPEEPTPEKSEAETPPVESVPEKPETDVTPELVKPSHPRPEVQSVSVTEKDPEPKEATTDDETIHAETPKQAPKVTAPDVLDDVPYTGAEPSSDIYAILGISYLVCLAGFAVISIARKNTK